MATFKCHTSAKNRDLYRFCGAAGTIAMYPREYNYGHILRLSSLRNLVLLLTCLIPVLFDVPKIVIVISSLLIANDFGLFKAPLRKHDVVTSQITTRCIVH